MESWWASVRLSIIAQTMSALSQRTVNTKMWSWHTSLEDPSQIWFAWTLIGSIMRYHTWILSVFALRSRKNFSWVIFLTSLTSPRVIRLMNSISWRLWSASLEPITWLISRWKNKGQTQSLFGNYTMITSQYKSIHNGKKSWRRFLNTAHYPLFWFMKKSIRRIKIMICLMQSM